MAQHNELGKIGEKVAREFLEGKRFKILDVNWRFAKDELDIIAEHDNFLVVVEVKTRSTWQYGEPHEAVNHKKQKLIIRAAEAYIQEKEIDKEVRFDVISIVMSGNDVTELTHIEDAFYATM
ncbi:MAG TPA: YraN family protein [Bacteroidales bacterium]|nr:YraN family protein [Bacteroidales bacterium]HPS15721.1 YraN family protein [Bacteroidales bacterium]